VDLWGGIADQATGRPWVEDTIELVYSSTKGATAVCANKLVQEGALDIDAPVAKYWPEFAQAGKDEMPVRFLLTHQAGLAWVDEELTLDEVLAWDPICDALARQAPVWEPGTAHGYHAVTYGYLVGEVVRRITGKSLGTYFHEEVAAPLGLDFWIGLPEAQEPRVAMLVGNLGTNTEELDEEARKMYDEFMGPESMLGRALTVNGAFGRDPEARKGNVFNSRKVHAAEVPAANGICDARSLARMYAACIGEVDGVRILDDAQMRDAATQRTSGPNIVLLNLDLQFGLGFFVPSSLMAVGGPHSFGHAGAGGSLGWADPDADLAFGYVMNRMEMGLAGDTRSFDLISACYDAVK
jgi:CubicO group peptidase (beta-lactamase class C family)